MTQQSFWPLCAGILGIALLPAEATAQPTISVKDLTDPPGVACSASVCSLRGAIKLINANMPTGSAIIQLVAGTYMLELAGADEDMSATGDLDVRARITINGAGRGKTVIQARGLDRIFDVHPGWSLTVRGVTISGGVASSIGGGIRNRGSLALVDSEVVDSWTYGAGNPGGGGIANEGSATLLHARVSRNGFVAGCGRTPTCTTTNNGGGVRNGVSATLTSTDTTMQGNSSIFAGGALQNEGKAVFVRSTISGNASRRGGGVNHNSGSLAFTNSTISGNSAQVDGGAIAASSNFSLVHTTVTLNTTSAIASKALSLNSGTATLQNSILEEGALARGFSFGTISSLGYNMEAGNSCVLSGTGDMHSVSAQLLPLQNTGGATKTHRPAYGSPAIDRIPVVRLPLDQRGVPRPQTVSFPLSDVGAVEALRLFDPALSDPADSSAPGALPY